MTRVAKFSTRRPRAVLIATAVAAIAFALIGLGVVHSLSPTITVLSGTESSRAQKLANAKFGPSVLVPILLEGPKAQLDQQGPKLVTQILKRPHTRALSAWDVGSASASLRPRPNQAMIVVSVDRTMKDVVKHDQPQIEKTVARVVHAPVRSYVTGQAALSRAIKDQALSDTLRYGLIAVGILFVLLLVGLRAPLAAAVLTLIGAAIVLDSFGVMAIMGRFVDVDPLGLAGATVRGLALGVGLSLLILDRFREEELPRAADGTQRAPAVASTRAAGTTGRAVLFIALMLILALLLSDAIGPTEILTSIGVGVLAAAVMAATAALFVMPAVLTLIGRPMVTGTFPAPAFMTRAWDRLVGAGGFVTRRAVIAGAVATALIAALAVPALALDTGPLDPRQLPKDAKARIAFEKIQKAMGAGWPTQFNVVVASPKGPITATSTLKAIDSFQQQVAKDPQVDSVIGPGAIRVQTKDLGKLPKQLQSSKKMLKTAPADLGKLANGLGQAGAGSKKLQSGLSQAAAGAGLLGGGAGQLKAGSAQAKSGAGQLHAGLATAHSGSAQISGGLNQALAGAEALKAGAGKALAGSAQLTNGLGQAAGPVNAGLPAIKGLVGTAQQASSQAQAVKGQTATTAAETAAAISALQSMTAGKSDPRYSETLAALERAHSAAVTSSGTSGELASNAGTTAAGVGAVETQTTALAAGLTTLHNGAGQLQSGISQLRTGNAELATGIQKLSGGGGQLTGGLTQLRDGAGALENGLGQLTAGAAQLQGGAGQLQAGLLGGVGPSGQLITGLGVMQAGVVKFGGQLPSAKDLEQLQRQSPGLFNSGYFVLAAVQGAPPASRNEASFAINLNRGGTAGQILVVPKHPASDPRTEALAKRLGDMSGTFARKSGTQVALGGLAAELVDFKSTANSRLPWVVAALAIATALVMMLMLRAILLPLVAVAFNLLTAAAAFGAMQLLFGGSNPPFGGPGWIDSVTMIETFTAIFGISLVFLVVLLERTREEYVASGNPHEGLAAGMRHTAAAATGVGLVMLAAIVPFAASELVNLRQLMTGLAVALLIDVFLVRPVLMPAAVEVLGHRGWWPTRAGARPAGKKRARRIHIPHPHAIHLRRGVGGITHMRERGER